MVERVYLVTYMYQTHVAGNSLRCHSEKCSLNMSEYYGWDSFTDGKIAECLLDKINRSNYNKYNIALVNFWLVEEKKTDTAGD